MGLHRGLRDDQGRGDLGVGQPGRDQPQHVQLALGQVGELVRERRPAHRLLGRREALHQPAGDRRLDQRVAAGRGPHRGDQPGGGRVLEQEAARPRLDRAVDVLVEVEGGQHDDPRRVVASAQDLLGRREPVELGHPDVHEHHVGLQLGDPAYGVQRRPRPRRPPRCRARRRGSPGSRRAAAAGRRRSAPGWSPAHHGVAPGRRVSSSRTIRVREGRSGGGRRRRRPVPSVRTARGSASTREGNRHEQGLRGHPPHRCRAGGRHERARRPADAGEHQRHRRGRRPRRLDQLAADPGLPGRHGPDPLAAPVDPRGHARHRGRAGRPRGGVRLGRALRRRPAAGRRAGVRRGPLRHRPHAVRGGRWCSRWVCRPWCSCETRPRGWTSSPFTAVIGIGAWAIGMYVTTRTSKNAAAPADDAVPVASHR